MECDSRKYSSEDRIHHHLALRVPHLLALEGRPYIQPLRGQVQSTIQLNGRVDELKLQSELSFILILFY